MQRDGQIRHQRLVGQPLERRQHADRRERDTPRRHGKTLSVIQHAQRFHRVVVVVERFAHAHQHDVEFRREQSEVFCQHANLAGDFAGREIAHQAHFAGEAEAALHRAADLSGDAEGLARCIGDEHGLDAPAVFELQQKLHGAVFGDFLVDDAGR